MVSIMTALYFDHLRGPDRVSVKPHASPVLHAIEYLLGHARPALPDDAARVRRAPVVPEPAQGSGSRRLLDGVGRDRRDRADLERPRAPLRRRSLRRARREGGRSRVVGDAELDEGAVWEAVVDPIVPKLGEVLWIVDMNRQSLDRVVPNIAAGRIAGCSRRPAGTRSTLKYGPPARGALRARRRRGAAPPDRAMPNEEYQRLLRAPAGDAARAPARGRRRPARRRARDLATSTTRSCCSRSATSAATTWRCCSTRSPPPTRWSTARR